MTEPWRKEAVFYEVPIKAFRDSKGDGIGDLAGLASKLDCLQHPEADCARFLPMYPSPLRDDGYDISDFRRIPLVPPGEMTWNNTSRRSCFWSSRLCSGRC